MKINHIALYTNDLERIREFYEKYFGAKANTKYHNKNTGLQTYFLGFEGSDTRLEIMTRPEISTGSDSEVDRLTEMLVKDGYKCLSGPRTTGDGYYESVIEDPDGNLIEITV